MNCPTLTLSSLGLNAVSSVLTQAVSIMKGSLVGSVYSVSCNPGYFNSPANLSISTTFQCATNGQWAQFNASCYLARYPDLVNAFGSSGTQAASNHWLTNGLGPTEARLGYCSIPFSPTIAVAAFSCNVQSCPTFSPSTAITTFSTTNLATNYVVSPEGCSSNLLTGVGYPGLGSICPVSCAVNFGVQGVSGQPTAWNFPCRF